MNLFSFFTSFSCFPGRPHKFDRFWRSNRRPVSCPVGPKGGLYLSYIIVSPCK
uniref:Uncharacterized protein n=1 Tax=Parascaris equorum TaxID=6256 RepID=A0A914RUJ8_PAREQ